MHPHIYGYAARLYGFFDLVRLPKLPRKAVLLIDPILVQTGGDIHALLSKAYRKINTFLNPYW
jgi:hypothetical protein